LRLAATAVSRITEDLVTSLPAYSFCGIDLALLLRA